MRVLPIAAAVVLLSCGSAMANEIRTIRGHLLSYSAAEPGGGDIPTVNRGDQLAIGCKDIKSPKSNVSVVLSIANAPGEGDTGYGAVLATQQKVAPRAVRVRVPDAPDLANHTVNVKVYVSDAGGIRACDAGRVRIG